MTDNTLRESILRVRFPYIDQQEVNRPVTVHWFDVLRAIETALAAPTTQPTDNTGLSDVEAMREACAKVVEGYRQNGPSNWQAMVEKIRALPLPKAQTDNTGLIEPVREMVARMISPQAWEDRENFQRILRGEGKQPDDAEHLAMYRRSAKRRVDTVIEPSLALADRILAAALATKDAEIASLKEALTASRKATNYWWEQWCNSVARAALVEAKP